MNELGEVLLRGARAAIASSFGGPPPETPHPIDGLFDRGACFVTLTDEGELRGCVGNVVAESTLWDALLHNAHAAAFRDHRFAPLSASELERAHISVSVLSPLTEVPARTEAELVGHLRIGTDGVVLRWRGRSATFLPQMWERLPDPHEFLLHLRRKGNFPSEHWPPGIAASKFTIEEYAE
jgi:hypothetical protein